MMDSLSKALIDSHGKCGLTASRWFDHLVDDVLAGFGLKLQTVPDSDVTEHLFILSGLYASEVINHAPFTDLLGPVHMQLVSRYQQKASGQFFTPDHICRMFAMMSLGTAPVKLESPSVIRISDPAVGAGGLLLAGLDHVAVSQGVDALRWISITGVDIDGLCARMFPCQVLSSLHVHQLPLGELIAYRGNALGDPDDLDLVCHYSRKDLPAEDIAPAGTLEHKEAVAVTAHQATLAEQITLF